MSRGLVAALLVIAAAGVAGYLSGKDAAPDAADAEEAGTEAYQDALVEAEQEAFAEAEERGDEEGSALGQRAGIRLGREQGRDEGGAEANQRLAATQPQPCPSTGAEPNVSEFSVVNMACEEAQSVIAKFGSISRSFTAGGFDCIRTSGTAQGGTWECSQGVRSFTFEFGD
jgi:flagellar biosynthesis/type III secretory pathway protein FliH